MQTDSSCTAAAPLPAGPSVTTTTALTPAAVFLLAPPPRPRRPPLFGQLPSSCEQAVASWQATLRMAEVVEFLDRLENGPNEERVFQSRIFVYKDGPHRYVLCTSFCSCAEKSLEVVTGLLPGLLTAAENKVVDKEQQVAPGDGDGPPVLMNPTESFPKYCAGRYTLAPDLGDRCDL